MAGESSQLNVLVIDDDEDVRALLIEILLPDEHQIFAVGSAEEGLQLLPYHTFQVAFLDQNLPGMEGLVLGEYLSKNNPEMVIALVTGNEDPRIPRLGEKLGMRFIAKPFEVREILAVIDEFRRSAQQTTDLPRAVGDRHPVLVDRVRGLAEAYGELKLPERIEEKLVREVRSRLTALRAERHYDEASRVEAYAGLVAIAVLGVEAPKLSSGLTLFEEYDELMSRHRLARAFTREPEG